MLKQVKSVTLAMVHIYIATHMKDLKLIDIAHFPTKIADYQNSFGWLRQNLKLNTLICWMYCQTI